MKYSKRTSWELSTNILTKSLEELKRRNVSVLDLTVSNPTGCGFDYPLPLLDALQRRDNLTYRPQAKGLLHAREAVVQYYKEKGFSFSPEQVFLTASTSEAYAYLFRLLADPSDHVLFPVPGYPLFQFLSELNDVEMDRYPLIYDEGWKIDFNQIQESTGARTRALIVVNPNNPTGSFVKAHELSLLNDHCLKHNIPIISDEVFCDYVLEPDASSVSLAGNTEVLTFVLGGLSKSLGMPQMKLSWIVVSGPKAHVDQALERLEVIADTFLSVNTPAQNALPVWLAGAKTIQEQIKGRIQDNFAFVREQARSTKSCRLLKAEGGWYVTIKISDVKSEERWALKFLNRYHVLVHPGYFFDFPDEAYIVLSLLPEKGIFQEAVQRLLSRVEQEAS